MNVFVILSICAFVCSLLISGIVFFKGRSTPKRNAFIKIALLAGTWSLFPAVSAAFPIQSTSVFFVKIVYLAALFTGPAFLTFGLTLGEGEQERLGRRLIKISYFTAVGFIPLLFSSLVIKGVSRYNPYFAIIPGKLFPLFILFFGLTCSYSFYKILIAYFKARGQGKNQMKYVFLAYFIAFLSAVIHFGSAYGLREIFPHDILVVTCMVILAYAILRYRLLDIRIAVVRLLVFLVVYIPILATPFFVTYFGKNTFYSHLGEFWWIIPIFFTTVLAPTGLYFYLYLQKKAEDRIKAKKLKYLEAISDFLDDIKHVRSLRELIDHVLDRSKDLIGANSAVLFLKDRHLPKYISKQKRDSNNKVRERALSQTGPLAQYLIKTGKPIILEELKFSNVKTEGYSLEDVENELVSLEANIVIPSFFGEELISFMTLNKPLSHEAYDDEDMEAFDTLGTNVGLALKNAQAVEDLKAVQVDLIASERFAAIGRLATSAKHEINNPLNFISGSMQKTMMTMDDYKDNYAKIRERLNNMYMGARTFLEPLEESAEGEVKDIIERFPVISEALERLEEEGKIKEAFHKKMDGYVKKIDDIKNDLEEASGKSGDKEKARTLMEASHLVRTILINFEKIVNPDKDIKDMVEYGQQGVERIKRVVEAMYNLPKDTGEKKEAINVRELIEESFTFVNYQTYWENLVDTPRETDISEDLPEIEGYRSKLVGVFSNLIINAYQAMTDAKLISRDDRMIRIKAMVSEEDERFIDIHFANKGPLIPEDNIDKIFEQGFTTKKTGTGLGLNICKIQIEVFNKGKISVRNIEGFGPEFIVRLPIRK